MIKKYNTNGDNSPILDNSPNSIVNINNIEPNKIFNPHNLKKVILFLDRNIDIILSDLKERNKGEKNNIRDIVKLYRDDFETKNKKNNLTNEYAKNIINNSIFFNDISNFLSEPRNKKISKAYNHIVITIRNYIPSLKSEHNEFDDVLNEIIERFFASNDIDVLENEAWVSILVHFMYYICDVGDINVDS